MGLRDDETWRDYVSRELRDQDAKLADVKTELAVLKAQTTDFGDLLEKNTNATTKISADTKEMLELFQSWKGAMKVLESIGRIAKPVSAISALGVSLVGWYYAWRHGPGK